MFGGETKSVQTAVLIFVFMQTSVLNTPPAGAGYEKKKKKKKKKKKPSSFPISGASFETSAGRIGFADPALLTKVFGHTDTLTD